MTEGFDTNFDASFPIVSGSDPWSDETWGKDALNLNFESDTEDVFEFSATSSVQGHLGGETDEQNSMFFENDPFIPFSSVQDETPKIQVAIHEQLSALYDDISPDPSCQVEGSIHVKPSARMSAPFCLVLRDLMGHVERLEERPEFCHNVSEKVSRQSLHKSDRVLRVNVPSNSPQEITVATYITVPSLRPVPMLVKSRVQISGKHSRVGFKIRANPANQHKLTRVVIILAVPPYVNGRSVKMSRKGGVWDEMKRTIAWKVDQLVPGEALEIQTQFQSSGEDAGGTTRFPVLVRAEYPVLFSSVELNSDFHDALSRPVKMKLSESSRVLHRKV